MALLLIIITGIDTYRSQSTTQPTYGPRWSKQKTVKRKEGESTVLRGAWLCSPSGSEESSKKLSRHAVCSTGVGVCFVERVEFKFCPPYTYMLYQSLGFRYYLKFETKYSCWAMRYMRVRNHSEMKKLGGKLTPDGWNNWPFSFIRETRASSGT